MTTPAKHTATALNPRMLADRQWLLRDGRKKPYYADGTARRGKLDSPKDLARLVSYEEAVAALAKKPPSWGLGFAINRGYQFADFDKCRDAATGNVASWLMPILEKAIKLGAYVEISISGTGFHLIGQGSELPTLKKNGVEVYISGRYCAIGEAIVSGADTPPDLAPLLPLLEAQAGAASVPVKKPPVLRLVGHIPLTWEDDKLKVPALLAKLDPSMEYPDWIRVGMALEHASGGDDSGLQLWNEWSKKSGKFKSGDCLYHWTRFNGTGVTFGTLVHMAEEASSLPVIEPMPEPAAAPAPRQTRFMDDDLDTMHIAPTQWVVEGLIAPGLTLLAAPPKMGKSYLVLQMALCVAAGVPFLGMPTHQTRVSYFDLEEWEALLKQRRDRIKKGHHLTRAPVSYVLEMTGGEIGVLQDLQAEIDAGSRLVVLDLLARVRDELGEDGRKNAYARDYAALRKFADFILQRNPHVALVIVHHTNKKSDVEGWQDKISGSQGLAGATHTNMLLANIDLRGLDESAKASARKYRVLHVVGKLVEAEDYTLKMMDNGGGWEVTEATIDDVKASGKQQAILAVLRESPGAWVTSEEVAKHLGEKPQNIRQIMYRMGIKGLIESQGRGGAGFRVPA